MHPAGLCPVLAAAVATAAVVGCGSSSSDRVGGDPTPKPVVLALASHNADPTLQDWADAVARESHGLVRIRLRTGWRGRQADYERGTIADVRAGRLDMAAIPARAFDTLGVDSFQALLAPFEVDSYALEREVLAGELPARLLGGVKPLGVTGVALLPGPMEKLLSITKPLLAPADYEIPRPIGVGRSRLAAATFRVLGTKTTDLAAKGDVFRFAAMEQGVADVVANHYQLVTAGETMPANVNFWPRIVTVVVNDKAYGALSRAQRRALSAAARDALGPGLARIMRDERAVLPRICKPESFFFLTASPADRAALRRAVAPVYGAISRDEGTRAALAWIDSTKRDATPEPAPTCAHRPTPRAAAARRLGAVGTLRRTAGGDWTGAITSPQLGRGTLRLLIRARRLVRSDLTAGLPHFVAHFGAGELRGCIVARTVPHAGFYRWDGAGVVEHATGRLRQYAHDSVRLFGVTTRSDVRHMRGGFSTDVPSGLPCDANQGI